MGFQLPYFETESDEADWWYDHRDLTSAEFLVAASEGKLVRKIRSGPNARTEPLPPSVIDPQELAEAWATLEKSGIWLKDEPTRFMSARPVVDELVKVR